MKSKRKNITLLITILLSLGIHILFSILLYNHSPNLYASTNQIFCNVIEPIKTFAFKFNKPSIQAPFTFKQEPPKKLSFELNEKQQDKSPAGKFRSSIRKPQTQQNTTKEEKEIIKRLYSTQDLKAQHNKNNPPNLKQPRSQKLPKSKKDQKEPQDSKEKKFSLFKGLKNLFKDKKQEEGYPLVFDDFIHNNDKVKESYIYRKRDYKDIVVKEVLPTIYDLDKPFTEIIQNSLKNIKKHKKRNEIIESFRTWEKGYNPHEYLKTQIHYTLGKTSPILNFSKENRQKFLDETLTLPKESQLNDFIRQYLKYDPNDGDLPIAVRELYYENLQRIAYSFSTDPTYFILDYLQENLNKENYLKNSLYQIKKLNNSKTAIEILFTLENIYEIQNRVVEQLLRFKFIEKRLPEHKKNRLQIETIRRVVKRYEPIFKTKGIHSPIQSYKKYSNKRLEILDYLIKTTPKRYRLKDAYFTKANILWEKARYFNNDTFLQQAIQIWRRIPYIKSTGDFLHKDIHKEVLSVLRDNKDINLKKNIISVALNKYFSSDLENKIKREHQLLWK